MQYLYCIYDKPSTYLPVDAPDFSPHDSAMSVQTALFAATAWVERRFLFLAVGFSALGLLHPPLFVWIKPYIPAGLGLIMFGMGLTLEFSDFARVSRQWPVVALGVSLQYTLMPGIAWALYAVLRLPPEAAVGVMLVGCCPAGTASNVIAYFAKADVPLSVTMSLASTLLAPLCTPILMELLAGQRVNVDFSAMAGSICWIVAFPVLAGLVLRRLLQARIRPLLHLFPPVSVLNIALVIACIMALNRQVILAVPLLVIAAVVLHNALGFLCGFWAARGVGADLTAARTIAIEVGIQNSGLAVALAGTFFGPAAALPGALFSLWQNLAGMFLARWWRSGQ